MLHHLQHNMMLFLETEPAQDENNKLYDNPFYGGRPNAEHNLQVGANPSYRIRHDLITTSDNQAYHIPHATNDHKVNTMEPHGENSHSYSYIV